MEDIKTELGKIYCIFNEDIDEFDKYRVIDITGTGDDRIISIDKLDNSYHLVKDSTEVKTYSIEEYKDFKSKHILLKSEGIISLTNVVSYRDDHLNIRDVILIYFPNNRVTKVPSIKEPFVVARQGVDNIFASMAGYVDQAGLSVSIETVPVGYALSDFIEAQEALSSKICHIYKTDRADEFSTLLGSETTDEILLDMYDHRVKYLSETRDNYQKYVDNCNGCVDGYCNSLYKFMIESGFIEDVMLRMGIRMVDFKLEENKPLEDDDKLLLSTLYGGIPICKAVPLKFDYEVNMDVVKMSYLLVLDSVGDLYIVPYTKSEDEIDATSIYNLTEERERELQDRLQKVVKAYDIHKFDTPTLTF